MNKDKVIVYFCEECGKMFRKRYNFSSECLCDKCLKKLRKEKQENVYRSN